MKSNQQKYIEYVMRFAKRSKSHIWLGGSFLHGNATLFSDVDISAFCNTENVSKLIYGYEKPVYISYTSNPLGIIIVVYADGVAVDLEIIEKIDAEDKEYFHIEDIKEHNYIRDEKIYRQFSLRDDTSYQVSRLFHRSLIKFLSGKKNIGVSVANEIVTFMDYQSFIDETCYKEKITNIIKSFDEQFMLSNEYSKILFELVEKLDKVDCQ